MTCDPEEALQKQIALMDWDGEVVINKPLICHNHEYAFLLPVQNGERDIMYWVDGQVQTAHCGKKLWYNPLELDPGHAECIFTGDTFKPIRWDAVADYRTTETTEPETSDDPSYSSEGRSLAEDEFEYTVDGDGRPSAVCIGDIRWHLHKYHVYERLVTGLISYVNFGTHSPSWSMSLCSTRAFGNDRFYSSLIPVDTMGYDEYDELLIEDRRNGTLIHNPVVEHSHKYSRTYAHDVTGSYSAILRARYAAACTVPHEKCWAKTYKPGEAGGSGKDYAPVWQDKVVATSSETG